jgi:hypothetical protein
MPLGLVTELGRKKQIQIRESEIPNIEFKVLTNNFQPLGTYSLNNFWKKYRGL